MLRHFLWPAIVGSMAWGAYQSWPLIPVRTAAGVLVPEEPVQEDLPPHEIGEINGYTVTGVADYTITARVLSTRRYGMDRGSALVPIDVALGWGRMSDQSVLDQFKISQAFRFFFYEWHGVPPLP